MFISGWAVSAGERSTSTIGPLTPSILIYVPLLKLFVSFLLYKSNDDPVKYNDGSGNCRLNAVIIVAVAAQLWVSLRNVSR